MIPEPDPELFSGRTPSEKLSSKLFFNSPRNQLISDASNVEETRITKRKTVYTFEAFKEGVFSKFQTKEICTEKFKSPRDNQNENLDETQRGQENKREGQDRQESEIFIAPLSARTQKMKNLDGLPLTRIFKMRKTTFLRRAKQSIGPINRTILTLVRDEPEEEVLENFEPLNESIDYPMELMLLQKTQSYFLKEEDEEKLDESCNCLMIKVDYLLKKYEQMCQKSQVLIEEVVRLRKNIIRGFFDDF